MLCRSCVVVDGAEVDGPGRPRSMLHLDGGIDERFEAKPDVLLCPVGRVSLTSRLPGDVVASVVSEQAVHRGQELLKRREVAAMNPESSQAKHILDMNL